jgi:hypothetical protein
MVDLNDGHPNKLFASGVHNWPNIFAIRLKRILDRDSEYFYDLKNLTYMKESNV